MKSRQPILETKGLHKSFGAVIAANDINVSVPGGQKLGLIGNNGAGKTTFVNMVTGYTKPDAGRILLDAEDVTAFGPRALSRQGVSRSFQIPQLCLNLTLEDNLLVALGVARPKRLSFWRPVRSAEIDIELETLLEQFRLRDYCGRSISVLPGGIRKLVDIAMAIVSRPKLLLLDEPTSGVSAEEKFPLMDVVMSALALGEVTVQFVEHDMDVVFSLADRISVLVSGRIIASGTPDEIRTNADVRYAYLGEDSEDLVEEAAGHAAR